MADKLNEIAVEVARRAWRGVRNANAELAQADRAVVAEKLKSKLLELNHLTKLAQALGLLYRGMGDIRVFLNKTFVLPSVKPTLEPKTYEAVFWILASEGGQIVSPFSEFTEEILNDTFLKTIDHRITVSKMEFGRVVEGDRTYNTYRFALVLPGDLVKAWG